MTPDRLSTTPAALADPTRRAILSRGSHEEGWSECFDRLEACVASVVDE